MARVTVFTTKGPVPFVGAHVSMTPDTREVVIVNDDSDVMETFTYDEVVDITVENL